MANCSDDLLADFHRWQQFTIVIVEHFVLGDPGAARRLLRFRVAPFGKDRASHVLVAGVAVGHRQELHLVSELRHLRGHTGGADVAIVRMRSDDDDADLGIGCKCDSHGERQ